MKAYRAAMVVCLGWQILHGCGEAPQYRSAYQDQGEAAQTDMQKADVSKDMKDVMSESVETGNPSSDKTAQQPAAVPTASVPAKAPIRTLPNDKEKSDMRTLYALPNNQGGCAGCHGALASSEKKGRTAQQIQNASTNFAHRAPAAANVWPRDTVDSSDDGIDNAKLFASALAEVLK